MTGGHGSARRELAPVAVDDLSIRYTHDGRAVLTAPGWQVELTARPHKNAHRSVLSWLHGEMGVVEGEILLWEQAIEEARGVA